MRSKRDAAWWMMVAGAAISTLGPMMTFLVGALFSSLSLYQLRELPGAFGLMVFFAGFALHALKNRAAAARVGELEMLVAAMSEEIRVLRTERP